jgi:hypothetical protein
MKATSLDQIREAFQRGGFSAAEIKRIEAEVRGDTFRRKLTGLKPKLPPLELNKLEVNKNRPATQVRSTKQAISSSNDRLKTAAIQDEGKVPAKVPNAPTISASEFEAIQSQPPAETIGRISSVNPSILWAGRAFKISGSYFGRGRGTVEILFEKRRYICDLESWRDTEIHAVVPEYMESIIGSRTHDALLWVKAAGQSLGPTQNIQLHPIPAPPGPEIFSLGSDEIEPGDSLVIYGRKFGKGRGLVWCEFAAMRVDLTPVIWEETNIRLRIPDDLGGIPKTKGMLYIRTAEGGEAKRSIGFIPVLEEIEIATYVELQGTLSVREVRTFEILRGSRLANGWKILSSRLEKTSGSGKYEYMREPTAGTDELYQVIILYTAAFSDLRVASKMIIRGPRGTDWL